MSHYVLSITDLGCARNAPAGLRAGAAGTLQRDPLTGLAGRALFQNLLRERVLEARGKHDKFALLVLDLDRFKRVNDTLGERAGDRLMRELAQRLTKLARSRDLVARLGADEFACLRHGVASVAQAMAFADALRGSVSAPYRFGEREVYLTASVGIALFPYGGHDAETLLRNADAALDAAKKQGRNSCQLYRLALDIRSPDNFELSNRMHRALEAHEFVLHYQPLVNIRSGRIVGMEALIRWQHPQRGLLAPAEFLPIAEETGLIVPIGAWVLETACGQSKSWEQAGFPALRVGVNLASRQVRERALPQMVARVLAKIGLSANRLELEITEHLFMEDPEGVVGMLSDLKRLGVQISMDDFGTGYTSLAYLNRFPIQSLKIDRSFVQGLATDPADASITTAIILLAHALNLKVTAEGVETEDQMTFLEEQRCDEMQGFLFSRPVPPREFETLLTRCAA